MKKLIAISVLTVLLAACGKEGAPGPIDVRAQLDADGVPKVCQDWLLSWDSTQANKPAGCEKWGNFPGGTK